MRFVFTRPSPLPCFFGLLPAAPPFSFLPCPAALRCGAVSFLSAPFVLCLHPPEVLPPSGEGKIGPAALRCGACVHFPPAESGQKGRRGAITPKAKCPPEPPVRALRSSQLLHPSPASAAGLRFPLLIAGVSAETPLRHRTAGRARSDGRNHVPPVNPLLFGRGTKVPPQREPRGWDVPASPPLFFCFM